MIRSLLFLLAVPIGQVVAQASAVHLSITSPNQAAYRIIRSGRDSVEHPLIARGRVEVLEELPATHAVGTLQLMEVTALDTMTPIHVEATQNGHVIAGGDGVYLTIQRDTSGVAIEARSHVPAAIARTLRRPL